MKLLSSLLFFMGMLGYAQTVSIDDSSYTPEQLVNRLLRDGCMETANISMSSNQSVAYFENNGGDFPIEEGVIIRSGVAAYTAGAYTGEGLSSQVNGNGDEALQEINDSSGQPSTITDVAFLQFDFTPLSNSFSFNFLFASNEYGQWQCVSSDVFAFLLTDLSTGETTNLALIPGTSIPVSVKNIRDEQYNNSCSSQHAGLFSTYNVDNPDAVINMRGYTAVMNASSAIVPGNQYRIRLVIGDSNDADFDSAIFLKAGSFNTDLNLGPDRSICDGDEIVLQTGLAENDYNHAWSFNGNEIPAETGNSIIVTQAGDYSVTVTKTGSDCLISDEVHISDLQMETPEDLTECYSTYNNYTYDLTQNNAQSLGLDSENYEVVFYANYADLQNSIPIPADQLTAFSGTANQVVYIKILNTVNNNFCSAEYSFNLLVNDPIIAVSPSPINVCYSELGSSIDLTQVNGEIIPDGNVQDYHFLYYLSLENAENRQGAISATSYDFSSGTSEQTIWVRVEHQNDQNCFTIVHFSVIERPLPEVDQLPDVTVCSEYQLPEIELGQYYTNPDGTGETLQPGDIVDEGGVYYIFSGPDEYGCTNQSSFRIEVVEDYMPELEHCGQFEIPPTPVGNYYTAIDGPYGNGELLATGTLLTSSQNIYYYAEVNGEMCRNVMFPITIHPLPPVDQPEDIVTCYNYVLPELINGEYYTGPNGNGTLLSAGDNITSSQTLYVFADDGTCTNQSTFHIAIIPHFEDIVACGSYELPPLEVGGYYTAALGAGQQIPEGTTLTSSQVVYIYAQTTTGYNCTEDLPVQVTIIPTPPVDLLDNVLLCEEEVYTLPSLTNGQYFTEPGRTGNELYPGDNIDSTQTIYINNIENGCDNESEFTVEIIELPFVETFTDVYTCDPYVLPTPANGVYYTGEGGTGTMLQPGDVIDHTQSIYLYNSSAQLPSCYNEQLFTVYVEGIQLEEIEDVFACDGYVLPELGIGNYYTETGGQGTMLHAGDVIDHSQTIYVYEISGDRFICENETSFTVTISETPALPNFENITRCGSYDLPILSNESYDVAYYWNEGGQDEITFDEYTLNEPGTYSIYVYATAIDNVNCFDEKEFVVTINPLRELSIENAVLCVDPSTDEVISPAWLESGLDPAIFQVDWYFNGELLHTGPDYEATQEGQYEVITTKLTPNDGFNCSYNPVVVQVEKSSKPIAKVEVEGNFSSNTAIVITILKGYGNYEYQLDNGPFQSQNTFDNVASGTHKVTIRSSGGVCGEEVLTVEVLNFPKFFTPNNDGQNDRWNIWDLSYDVNAKVNIYNRYGKLLTTILPSREGWDGLYHNKQLPSDDYWFTVSYIKDGNQKNFTSHFTLKR